MIGLTAVGISELESQVYEELVRRRSVEPTSLAEIIGLPLERANRVYAKLEARGLIGRSAGPTTRLIAAPPEAALEALVLERLAILERVRLASSELGRVYRSSPLGQKPDELVEITVGRDAILQRLEQVQRGARNELLTFTAAPFIVPIHENDTGLGLLQRGVAVRSIYERDALETPGAIEHVRKYATAGEESRVLDSVPLKLLIADRELALVPLGMSEHDAEPGCVILHPCSLLDALVRLFDVLWAASRPLSEALTAPPSQRPPEIGDASDLVAGNDTETVLAETDREMLTLLLAGLPDQAVARQLNISGRTLQRRVTSLLRTAGVSNRLQLGWHAATHGWLDPTGADQNERPAGRRETCR